MKKKILATIVFLLYIAVLLKITVFREGFSNNTFFNGSINFVFIKEYRYFLYSKSYIKLIYLFVGNIIWFIPLGYFLNRICKLGFFKTVLITFFFSLFIETMQYVLSTGISELDDLSLNTFGGLIGGLMGLHKEKKIKKNKD